MIRLTDETLVDGMAGLRWRLRAQLATGARYVVVDVKRVRQLSSRVVSALLNAHQVCRMRGGGVVVRNPNRAAVDLLRRHGLHHVFTIEGANAHLTRREYSVPPLRARRLGVQAARRQRRRARDGRWGSADLSAVRARLALAG